MRGLFLCRQPALTTSSHKPHARLQGKTTLIRALFSVPGQELHLHDGTETSPEQFRRDPDSLCTTISWEDEDESISWVYQVRLHLSCALAASLGTL